MYHLHSAVGTMCATLCIMQRIANEKAAVLLSRALPNNTAGAMLNSCESQLGVAKKIFSSIHCSALNEETLSAITAALTPQAPLQSHFTAAVAFQ